MSRGTSAVPMLTQGTDVVAATRGGVCNARASLRSPLPHGTRFAAWDGSHAALELLEGPDGIAPITL